jgi:hypothetical protein
MILAFPVPIGKSWARYASEEASFDAQENLEHSPRIAARTFPGMKSWNTIMVLMQTPSLLVSNAIDLCCSNSIAGNAALTGCWKHQIGTFLAEWSEMK